MKVFLTGATGYVGSVVAEKLKGRGHKVLGLARNDEAEAKLNEKKIEVIRGELSDFEVLKSGSIEADAVIHTAFSHNFSDYNDAVKLDREVIKAFAEAMNQTNKRLIVTSSSAVLGDTRGNEADEDYPFGESSPRKFRGESERDTEQLSSKGIRSIILRLPLFVYGRGGSSFVPFIINQAKKEGSANYLETGDQKVSAVHVEDVADLYVLALETSTAKGLYNVAAESISLKELNEGVARLLNIKAKSISAEKAKEQFGQMFDFLSINNQLSAEKAKGNLRWSPNSNKTILEDIENGSYRNFKD
ncbi:MAG TPA: SDR family oxidoreductase [Pyrinomonadaceae bacterium]|nr:SDR family oxidoreductase [Pyrinomonadaceae bacterium]